MKPGIKFGIYLSLTLTGILTAAAPGDSLIWAGINAWYNYETAQSVAILDSARRLYPEHPTVHLVYAAARYQHSQASAPVEDNYRVLAADLAEIIPIYENLIERYPELPVYRLYYGSAIGLKARIHLGRKEWISTLWSAYRGFSIIRKVARDNPDLIDAQLPIGIVEYYSGLSGGLVKLAAGMFGLEPSVMTGREAILRAADQGEFAWMEAKGIIIYLYLYIENNPEAALRHARTLVATFPGNWYYHQLLTQCYLAAGDVQNGRRALEWIAEHFDALSATNKTNFTGYLNYEWAHFYYLQDDWGQALVYLDRSIDGYRAELDAVLAEALLLKGRILDARGERVGAVQCYREVIALDNFSHTIRLAEQHLRMPYRPDN
ncbi:MAG: hypothetical protein ABIA75_10665 [Candidatus Neomarinimicrobiota bacterium]